MKRPFFVSLALSLAVVVSAPHARADEKDACVAAHSSGQVVRNEGKLRAARASFQTCASDKCPPLVRRDCAQWHQELTAAQPSFVFEVHDARNVETSDVKIRVDGELIAERLGGTAHEIDPGDHVFRFELASGEIIEQKIVARVGEKNRRLVVRSASIPVAPPPPPLVPRERPREPAQEPRGVSPLVFVLGGVTVASLAVFAGFSIAGLSKENDLRDTCAPFCAQSDIDTAKRDYLIGDIGLGVGIVAAAATVYVLVSGQSSRPVAAVTSRAP